MTDGSQTQEKVFFVIGPPRSGSTLLAQMIGSHSQVYSRPEPHVLTALAHLGYYAKVDRAPYDAVLAGESIRQFVQDLAGGEQDYIDACRAYCDTLYDRALSAHPHSELFLDKTATYGLILDFMVRLYPNAKYVIFTRHPLAVFSSYAEAFFDSDYQTAHNYNPIVARYVPALAKFLREKQASTYHVVYEQMVADPETTLSEIFDFLELPNEPQAVDYGAQQLAARGLDAPIGAAKQNPATTDSLHKWAEEIANQEERSILCENIIAQLDPSDLALWGHPIETIWQPLAAAKNSGEVLQPNKLDRYQLQSKAIVTLRGLAKRSSAFKGLLERLRLGTDVLLR